MTVQRRGDFPLHELRRFLETRGWDVFMTEAGTLEASLHGAAGVFRLKADRGGRVYLKRTNTAAPPRSQTFVIKGNAYAFQESTTHHWETAATLENAEDFPRVFETMMEIVTSKWLADTDENAPRPERRGKPIP